MRKSGPNKTWLETDAQVHLFEVDQSALWTKAFHAENSKMKVYNSYTGNCAQEMEELTIPT